MDKHTKLLDGVARFIEANPGKDAVDVARALGIPLRKAMELVDELLQAGALTFAE